MGGMTKKATPKQRYAICATAPAHEKSWKRYERGLRMKRPTRDRIEAAICELGLTHLLAEPLHDPDAAEDLAQ